MTDTAAERVFITGITGFVGSHLAEYIRVHHPRVEVHGLARPESSTEYLDAVGDELVLWRGDLLDRESLEAALREARPDVVFHLAARSVVGPSFSSPGETLRHNVFGTLNLLEAVRAAGLSPVVQVCSSSAVYGPAGGGAPLTEEAPFQPASPYAVSKVSAEMLALQYHLAHGLGTIRARLFNHTGPRRGEAFVESSLARQIARMEKGLEEARLRVGNLEARRTFLDVRDAVRAYWLLVHQGLPGQAYNVAGAHTLSIGALVEALSALAGVEVELEVRAELLRPGDFSQPPPSTEKLRRATGWEPRIPFDRTLRDLLDWWRARV